MNDEGSGPRRDERQAMAEIRAYDEEAKRELGRAAEALTSGRLLARSRHAARAEALAQARDRALRKLRGKGE